MEIVKKCPALIDLRTVDKTSFAVPTWDSDGHSISAASRTDRIVTITAAGHDITQGDMVTVADTEGSTDFDGSYEVRSVSGSDIVVRQIADDDTATSFGTITKIAEKPYIDMSSLSPLPYFVHEIKLLDGSGILQSDLRHMSWQRFNPKYRPVPPTTSGIPSYYSQSGRYIYELDVPISVDAKSYVWQIEHTKWPTLLANGSTKCELAESDDGLRFFALARIYEAIDFAETGTAMGQLALKARAKFDHWVVEYSDLNQMMLEEAFEE